MSLIIYGSGQRFQVHTGWYGAPPDGGKGKVQAIMLVEAPIGSPLPKVVAQFDLDDFHDETTKSHIIAVARLLNRIHDRLANKLIEDVS